MLRGLVEEQNAANRHNPDSWEVMVKFLFIECEKLNTLKESINSTVGRHLSYRTVFVPY